MDFLVTLITSGHIIDIALGFLALEFAWLLFRGRSTDNKGRVTTLVLALGPGACLMIALRCALTGANPLWLVFWLSASLPLHILDLSRRRL
jgi:hypothetical protein